MIHIVSDSQNYDCTMCKDTREIVVDDGAGGVDFDQCPKCQQVSADDHDRRYSDLYDTLNGDHGDLDVPF